MTQIDKKAKITIDEKREVLCYYFLLLMLVQPEKGFTHWSNAKCLFFNSSFSIDRFYSLVITEEKYYKTNHNS